MPAPIPLAPLPGPGAGHAEYGADVVPPAGVGASGVVAELEEDLLGLEGGQDGLEEHGRLDGPPAQAKGALEGIDDEEGPDARRLAG